MKFRNFFRILLCSVALFSLAACSKEEAPSFIDDGNTCYVGDIVVPGYGSNFTDKDIKVELTFNEADKTVDMLIKEVKFAEAMPLRLDMTVKGISYTVAGSKITIVGDNIVPEAMGGPFEMYKITDLSGEVTASDFSFSMKCGEFPVTFTGKAVLTSAK